ncbi:hypothetical protein LCGC14_2590200, partial [marine sediment metagenome]
MKNLICDVNLAYEVISDERTAVIGPNEFMRSGKIYYVSDELKEISMNRCFYELEKYLGNVEDE